jgi:hypothetical protein
MNAPSVLSRRGYEQMTSVEKIRKLREIQLRENLARIITVKNENFLCKTIQFAEDEDDWAYDVEVLNDPAFEYMVIEGCCIKSIEEVPQYLA